MAYKHTFINRHLDLIFEGKFSPLEIQKGGDLFRRKQSLFISEDKDINGGLTIGVEEGDSLFKVSISNYFDNHIRIKCTCEFGQQGHCSHGFASLLLLDQEVLSVSGKAQKYVAYTRDRENRTSVPLEKFTTEYLTEQALEQGFLMSDLSHYHFRYLNTLDSDFIGEVVPGFLRNSEKKRVVKVSFLNSTLHLVCNCGHQFGRLCKHQTTALLKLVNEPFFPSVIIEEERNELIFKELKDYGLQGKIEPSQFAHFALNPFSELVLQKEEAYSGIIPVTSEAVDFSLLLKGLDVEQEDQYLPQAIAADVEDSNDYALGYSLVLGTKPYYFSVVPLSGKLNRAQTALQTNIRPFYHDQYVPVQESDLDDRLQVLVRKLTMDRVFEYIESKNIAFDDELALTMGAARYQYPYLVELFNYLSQAEFTYVVESHNDSAAATFNKSTLQNREFSNKRAQFFLRVSEDENFIFLTPKIDIEGLEYSLDDENIKICNHLMIEFRREIFLIENLHQAFGLYRFSKGISYKMSVEHRETFLQKYICPLSAMYKIVFDDTETIDIEEVKLVYLKSKLYVSSTDNYVTFKPVVEYEGGYELELYKVGNPITLFSNFVNIHLRDQEKEQEFATFLRGLNPHFAKQYPESFLYLNNTEMMRDFWFHSAFEQMSAAGIEIYGINDLKKLKYSPHQASIRTQIASGIDWFEVSVEVAFGDNIVTLAEVKKAILKKDKFIKLSDGTIGVLPDEWIGRFERFFKVGDTDKEQILISKRMFSAAEILFDGIDYEAIKDELYEKQNRLKSFSEIKNVVLPEGIQAELMNYQVEGVNWLNFLDEFKWGGILADDMGLGKTLQTIVFLKMMSERNSLPNLVVVPTSLIYNWENEIQKFCPSLTRLFYYGLDRAGDFEKFGEYNIVVTTYGILLNEEDKFKDLEFNYVVLDESQNIKNLSSKRYKSVSKLKSNNRLAITGTPIENSTFDLYAQMNFVNPGFLGTPAFFRDYFSNNIDKEKNDKVAAELQKIINPFILRRTKEQVALELPPKTEEIIFYEMGDEQRKVYDAFRNKLRNEIHQRIEKDGVDKTKMHVLKGLICLRQICDSPALLNKIEDYGDDSVKIRELMRVITQKSGNHKILIFSQFVTMLHLIRKEIQELRIGFEYLDGSSSPKQRDTSVANFQNNEDCRIFLVSLKAGGTGLNLTAADYVYLVDPWWNPAVETQAIDRTHRIGQNKPVFAYRLICKDSVEEKIINYQRRKQKVASDVIYTGQSFIKELTKADIDDIFK